jgi:TIR domain-containing protein
MRGKMSISYRREDSRWSARSLYDRLTAHFDQKQIFMDVDGLPSGTDSVKTIERRVSGCDVLIAVIGPHWITCSSGLGGRRLDNPEDFVRMEIAAALRRNIRVIPVLVDGASIPRSDDLPDDLKSIVRRNALFVSATNFDDVCRRLVEVIERIFERKRKSLSKRISAFVAIPLVVCGLIYLGIKSYRPPPVQPASVETEDSSSRVK